MAANTQAPSKDRANFHFQIPLPVRKRLELCPCLEDRTHCHSIGPAILLRALHDFRFLVAVVDLNADASGAGAEEAASVSWPVA